MPDEQNNKPAETPQVSRPQEAPKESKVIELNESFAGKSQPGNQGILLNPVGGHNTDPFVSQDIPASPISPESIMPQAAMPLDSPTPVVPQTTTTPAVPTPAPLADATSSNE